jgi:large subunit ribosomal protein L18
VGKVWSRSATRVKKHYKLRRHISGTAERPRLCITKTLKHIYAQVIDDTALDNRGFESGKTIVAASSREKPLVEALSGTGNVEAAKAVGTAVAQRAVEKGVTKVVFDRGGWLYHGKIKALADAAREAGLDF